MIEIYAYEAIIDQNMVKILQLIIVEFEVMARIVFLI